MAQIVTNAIVVRRADYRENDRMITLFSPTMGRIDALCRGCRRQKSPLMAASELFCAGEYVLYQTSERATVVSCQVERSQYQNRDMAMRMLMSKLVEIKEREHLDKISDIKGEQKEITWGSQIRSYVFMPYTLAKDHRTGCEKGNINAVMDGEIDEFITAYLKALSQGTLGENIE